ncbi:hypothetical protein AA103196_2525 [Ameyamaea chiangmaiensis NBRC 103196]|nr:hypothetical protein [Ameyamaea chiangmaiensis]GBQ70572.1 hypothetical protein AA103196_2525 [Ameyamaea chiangmaiensis NBRC 103196]
MVALGIGLALICGPLAGCKPLDQRTFNPAAGKPPKPYIPPAPPAHVTPPLVEIIAGTTPDTWQAAVTKATRAALARKPSVLFTVTAVVRAQGDALAQGAAMAHLVDTDAQAVAATIIAAGAPAAQVQMTAMPDPGVQHDVTRVYIR